MKIVVDGYNAPVTAGAFVDLVQKKFYDGMEVQRSDGLVVQTGRPENVSLLSLLRDIQHGRERFLLLHICYSMAARQCTCLCVGRVSLLVGALHCSDDTL